MKHFILFLILFVSVTFTIYASTPPMESDVTMQPDDTLIIYRDSLNTDTIYFNNGQPIPQRIMKAL